MQLWRSTAAALLDHIKGTRLVSTSWSSGRRLKDLQCTDTLTLRRYKSLTNFFCTGEKSSLPLLFPTRSGDEWLVGEKGLRALLKASVGNNPDQPPTNGWKFYNFDTYDYVDDPSLSCTLPTSTSCVLTVVLTNLEEHAECAGVYKATGLVSMGREVEAVLSLI